MECLDAKTRLRVLAESAEIHIDSNIPIRRYYRSGNEMLRMAKVYDEEKNMEAAYVLYLKYVTLFLEKIMSHKDYQQVLPAEKKKNKETLKIVLAISETMKVKLERKFEEEHREWQAKEKIRLKEEEERRRAEEELDRKRREEERRKQELIEKDHQLAMWTQAQIDKGVDIDNLPGKTPLVEPAPAAAPEVQPSAPTHGALPAPNLEPESFAPRAPELPSFADDTPIEQTVFPSQPTNMHFVPSQPLPTFDRSSKPTHSSADPSTKDTAGATISTAIKPSIPDRSTKPVFKAQEQRNVIVPERVIEKFLAIAKPNSDRDIETLGMLGGTLAKNRFTVTHLLIPKQTGKSDRCDLENHEEMGDTFDSEDIIMLGWIHTHPAYDVFLSSVDMHNQYVYQRMLHEFVAIVCSIKFKDTGYLTLTNEGMEEVKNCTQENFHLHSKDPPMFTHASHVVVDKSMDIIVKDLR